MQFLCSTQSVKLLKTNIITLLPYSVVTCQGLTCRASLKDNLYKNNKYFPTFQFSIFLHNFLESQFISGNVEPISQNRLRSSLELFSAISLTPFSSLSSPCHLNQISPPTGDSSSTLKLSKNHWGQIRTVGWIINTPEF